jgi:hypothetical protein
MWALRAEGQELRQPAPGVMTTIRPFINYSETFQWSDIPEIVAEAEGEDDQSFDWARNVYFSKEVWCLQFSFKPVRFIPVDFPNDEGKMDRKTVWYMVYSVTNTGQFVGSGVSSAKEYEVDNTVNVMLRQEGEYESDDDRAEITAGQKLSEVYRPGYRGVEAVTHEQKAFNLDGVYVINEIDYLNGTSRLMQVNEGETRDGVKSYDLQPLGDPKPLTSGETPLTDEQINERGTVRFSPRFILAVRNLIGDLDYEKADDGFYGAKETKRVEKTWDDQYLPLALTRIAAIEDPNRTFQNSVSFPTVDIAPGETYWGIVTWTDIDPRVNDFSIYISGLTNALRWSDDDVEAYNKENRVPLTGRKVMRKTLKLNFFRPGDLNIVPESKVYFGVPGQKASDWVYL